MSSSRAAHALDMAKGSTSLQLEICRMALTKGASMQRKSHPADVRPSLSSTGRSQKGKPSNSHCVSPSPGSNIPRNQAQHLWHLATFQDGNSEECNPSLHPKPTPKQCRRGQTTGRGQRNAPDLNQRFCKALWMLMENTITWVPGRSTPGPVDSGIAESQMVQADGDAINYMVTQGGQIFNQSLKSSSAEIDCWDAEVQRPQAGEAKPPGPPGGVALELSICPKEVGICGCVDEGDAKAMCTSRAKCAHCWTF
eukprot:s611_g13.t1